MTLTADKLGSGGQGQVSKPRPLANSRSKRILSKTCQACHILPP